MATCLKAEWDVLHGKFYAVVKFPGDLIIHDIALRAPADGPVTAEPPPNICWPETMAETAKRAIVSYLRWKIQTKPFSKSENKRALTTIC